MFEDLRIFVSVGSTSNHRQEAFLSAVEGRLRSEGLIPQTVGRNFFSSDAPLKTVTELMDSCAGAVIIALERKYFPAGVEKRGGPNEVKLSEVKFATPWNQIEAAMAYSRGLPLMVITEVGLWEEGLLDHGNEWYIQSVALDPVFLELYGVQWSTSELEGESARKKGPQANQCSSGRERCRSDNKAVGQRIEAESALGFARCRDRLRCGPP
jgi:hypothetical protein